VESQTCPATGDGNHFIQVFNFGVARTLFDRSDRAYYGLDVNRADVPPLNNHARNRAT
jgi:hypothetical protein